MSMSIPMCPLGSSYDALRRRPPGPPGFIEVHQILALPPRCRVPQQPAAGVMVPVCGVGGS